MLGWHCFVFFALLLSVHALIDLPFHARGGIAWKLRRGIAVERVSGDQQSFFDQKLDHFDSANTQQFKQKYFVNRDYYQEGAPIFLNIGGEGPAGGTDTGGFQGVLARKFNALLITVEHRYYGDSVPNGDLTTPNLKYLSTKQALADIANFIDFWWTQEESQGKQRSKFFTFGGSYSGALSAWFRLKYPDHSVGSLSSSGVVNAILNFTAFDEQVRVSSGPVCSDYVRKTTQAFETAIKNGRGDEVKGLFNAASLIDPDFFYMIADSAAMAVQYGNKAALCNSFTGVPYDDDKLMKTFAKFTNTFWGTEFGSSCFYNSSCLKYDPSKWQPTNRAWRWQKCSELAYFQIAPSSGSLRSEIITLDYHMKQCHFIFGDQVSPKTEETNEWYGGNQPNGTNIFFSDFSDDPWQQASVLKEVNEQEPFSLVTCDGCGHCMDLGGPSPDDPPQLQDSRLRFIKYLQKWLNM